MLDQLSHFALSYGGGEDKYVHSFIPVFMNLNYLILAFCHFASRQFKLEFKFDAPMLFYTMIKWHVSFSIPWINF